MNDNVFHDLKGVDPDILAVMSNDVDPRVRMRVAQHPSTPGYILQLLSHDPDDDVRSAVAGNEMTEVSILTILSDDPVSEIRENVVTNPSTPIEIVASHMNDDSASCRYYAGIALMSRLGENKNE